MAQVVPVKRERLDIDIQAMSEADYEAARGLKERIKAERGYYKNHIRRDRP